MAPSRGPVFCRLVGIYAKFRENKNWPGSGSCANKWKPAKKPECHRIVCMDTRLTAHSPRAGTGPDPNVVLVVDSNPALLQTLDSILKSSGWTCILATDTLSALCCMVEHTPQ